MVSAGFNYNILDPFYHANAPKLSVHAEESAILNLIRIARGARVNSNGAVGKGRRYTLYVVRINNQGEYRLSAPCDDCTELINDFGVRKVVHS